jgi:periplasmic divalent cation tolerance protein
MTDFILVQTSSDSRDGAQKIADAVVGKHLAACCWVSGPITSTYWWKGKIEQAQEWVCSFKTRNELYNNLEQAIREIHPYEIPEIVATPIISGSQNYLDWITSETTRARVRSGWSGACRRCSCLNDAKGMR